MYDKLLKMKLPLKYLLAFSLVLLFSVSLFAEAENVLPPPFNFIKWNFDKNEINKTYAKYLMENYESPSKMNANTGKGKYVYGKLRSITVQNYNWKGYFPVNITFNTIKKYNFIQITSQKNWNNCDLPQVDENKCKKQYEEMKRLYENTIIKLNESFGEKGTYEALDEQIEDEKMYTWFVNGFEISFSLIVDDSVSFLQFFIREG